MLSCYKSYAPTRRHRGAPVGKRGFTLLIAAIIATIALSLGTSIFDIAQKEVTLSSIGKQSQYAFYVADTGAECALYWDVRYSYFATSTPSGVNPACDGTVLVVTPPSGSYPYTQNFQFESNQRCVNVSVTKSLAPDTTVQTTIHSDGFNVACSKVSTSPIALERSVELNY